MPNYHFYQARARIINCYRSSYTVDHTQISTYLGRMNKLKSIFKKDKETRSEDLPTSYNQGQSTGSTGAQGYSQAASSAGGKPGYTEGSSATGDAQSGYSQGGAQSGYSQGGAQSGYSQGQSGGQAAPTATSFPSANAPSTGQEHADNAQGVVVHTTLGDITIALFSQQTPKVSHSIPSPSSDISDHIYTDVQKLRDPSRNR